MTYLIPIIALFFLLWLVIIRPQRRRQMQQIEMQNEVHVDDEIITAGGIHAHVRELGDDVITVEIAPQIRVRLDRRAVAAVVHPDDVEAEIEEAPEIERADG